MTKRQIKREIVLRFWTDAGHTEDFPTTGFLAEWLHDYENAQNGSIDEEICKIALKCAIENYQERKDLLSFLLFKKRKKDYE